MGSSFGPVRPITNKFDEAVAVQAASSQPQIQGHGCIQAMTAMSFASGNHQSPVKLLEQL